jgi:L-lactate dehydrogenase complex protein LldG
VVARTPVTARAEILGRVRAALGASPPESYEREPPHPAPLGPGAALALLRERLLELGADVYAATAATLAETLRGSCAVHGARRIVVPDDWPETWTPSGLEVEHDGGRQVSSLGTFDGALTAARLAIAESGTIVFDGGPRQGRRQLTLLPELHVCVLRTADVADSIAAAMMLIRPHDGAASALTFVSGVSATTDIELTRVEGVHGPRKLAVVLLEN